MFIYDYIPDGDRNPFAPRLIKWIKQKQMPAGTVFSFIPNPKVDPDLYSMKATELRCLESMVGYELLSPDIDYWGTNYVVTDKFAELLQVQYALDNL